MPLHPQAQALRERRARAGTPPLYSLTPAQARAADLADIRAAAGTPEPVAAVEEHRIPGPGGELALRLYRPEPPGRQLPALLYLFGGGWTLGSPDTSDAICRRLTNAVGCVTASVGYRLAPEHPFPAAVHDCRAAARWLAGNAEGLGLDPARLAVGGDSAGGNLAAALTLLARDEGGPALCHQLLVYPNTDHRAASAAAGSSTTTRCSSTAVRWRGTGGTTWPTPPTATTRSPPRCAPRAWPGCRPPP